MTNDGYSCFCEFVPFMASERYHLERPDLHNYSSGGFTLRQRDMALSFRGSDVSPCLRQLLYEGQSKCQRIRIEMFRKWVSVTQAKLISVCRATDCGGGVGYDVCLAIMCQKVLSFVRDSE